MTKLTSEARRTASLYQSLRRQHRERWVISFNCTNSYIPETGRYRKYVWPILFLSKAEADLAMKILPIFANSQEIPGRGRIKSACVERRLLAA